MILSSFGRRWIALPDAPAARRVIGGREVLTTNRTYYVRTDGSDGNTGLVHTAGGAFLTIQRAIDVVAGLDRGIHDVTIQLGAGTFATANGNVCKPGVGAGKIIIVGDEATPSNTIVTVTGVMSISDACFVSRGHLTCYSIRGVKLTSSATGSPFGLFASSNAYMEFQNVDFGSLAGGQHIRAEDGGVLRATGGYAISGGSVIHWASVNATIRIQSVTITLTGTPAFTARFAFASFVGFIIANGNSFVGAATGTRYLVDGNSVLQTGGGGATYIPGSLAGSVATGGQYV